MMENRESVSSKLISYAHLSNMYHFQYSVGLALTIHSRQVMGRFIWQQQRTTCLFHIEKKNGWQISFLSECRLSHDSKQFSVLFSQQRNRTHEFLPRTSQAPYYLLVSSNGKGTRNRDGVWMHNKWVNILKAIPCIYL